MKEPNESDEHVRQLQQRMVDLIRTFGLLHAEMTPCGEPMSISEAHALIELQQTDALSQNALAGRLRLEKSTVSRLITQLEDRGWLYKEPSPHDGRMHLLRLTEAGRRATHNLDVARRAKYRQLLESIPEAERANVLRALDVLAIALGDDHA